MENVQLFFKEMLSRLDEVEDNKYWGIIVLNDELINLYCNNISNKIFSIDKEDRRIYLNLILSGIESQAFCPIYDRVEIEERNVYKKVVGDNTIYSFEYKDGYVEDMATTEIYLAEFNGRLIDVGNAVVNIQYFISKVFFLFEEFGFNMNEIIKSRTDLDYNYEPILSLLVGMKDGSCKIDNIGEYNIIKRHKLIIPKASLSQQWTIIRNLMECATGWRLTNNENELMYNKTDIAKFLSFLCGGSEDRIRKQLEKEIVAKDANAMMPYLESIGLNEIANKIKKDLE